MTTKQFIVVFSFLFDSSLSLLLSFFGLVRSHCFVPYSFSYCFVLWLRHITMCALYKLPCPVSCITLFIVYIIFFSFVHSSSSHSIVICREVDIFSVKMIVCTMTCSMLNPIFNHFFFFLQLNCLPSFSRIIIIIIFQTEIKRKTLALTRQNS